MPRRPDSRERLLSGTALRRRPGQPKPELESDSGAAGSKAENTVPVARGTAARRNRALKLSEQIQPSRPTGARRPAVLGRGPTTTTVSSPSSTSGAGPTGSRASVATSSFAAGSNQRQSRRSAGSTATAARNRSGRAGLGHPLSDRSTNAALRSYDLEVKEAFDRIVPLLKQLSALQHEDDFVARAQQLAQASLGYTLPLTILERAWVSQLDMRTLFAWCVFETYEQTSASFFQDDPLGGKPGSAAAEAFDAFLLECGFHLLDVTPCADGRLAHAIAYALRLPFSSVRRRPHAGALFDVENTVNRWVKTEHRRYREGLPNPAHADTRYLKVVLYHFSSLDPSHEGCAAHGSDDALAASCGLSRLRDFQTAVENSFCCGASVDLLLVGLDTDTDAIRVHVPGLDGSTNLDRWLDARDVYAATAALPAAEGRSRILSLVEQAAASTPDPGMVRLIARLLEHNISQIDYVRDYHDGHYSDGSHAERFIGVGIGFKEIHLRNLTYFAYMDTVEEGAPDLDVGIKIFSGLNVSRGLPVPVVARFDYHGQVPGARERAVLHAQRIQAAIETRYPELVAQGLLHTLLTIRDQDRHVPAEAVGSTISFATPGGH